MTNVKLRWVSGCWGGGVKGEAIDMNRATMVSAADGDDDDDEVNDEWVFYTLYGDWDGGRDWMA